MDSSVGNDFLGFNWIAIHNQLDRNFTRIVDTGTLRVPVGFVRQRSVFNRCVRFLWKKGRCFHRYVQYLSFRNIENTCLVTSTLLADAQSVDFKVVEVCLAIGAITASIPNALNPAFIGEGLIVVEFDINSAQTHTFAIHAGKIGLPADAALVTAIQRVVPDIEFPGDWRIDT